eukprot:TRINITY_DN19284_c0_g2_i1.p1 TRINITY_DN19284_c0_g2~~TRINITY_DN19284_c0_g2_i1.p1  ORF type:complete len:713 (-),score=169.34 TRINITY_DN19284_c0_g2_i1:64-2202(-)
MATEDGGGSAEADSAHPKPIRSICASMTSEDVSKTASKKTKRKKARPGESDGVGSGQGAATDGRGLLPIRQDGQDAAASGEPSSPEAPGPDWLRRSDAVDQSSTGGTPRTPDFRSDPTYHRMQELMTGSLARLERQQRGSLQALQAACGEVKELMQQRAACASSLVSSASSSASPHEALSFVKGLGALGVLKPEELDLSSMQAFQKSLAKTPQKDKAAVPALVVTPPPQQGQAGSTKAGGNQASAKLLTVSGATKQKSEVATRFGSLMVAGGVDGFEASEDLGTSVEEDGKPRNTCKGISPSTAMRVREMALKAYELREEDPTSCCGRIANRGDFEAVCGAIILINAVYVGVQSQIQMKEAISKETENVSWLLPDFLFCMCFSIEFFIRAYAQGRRKFFTSETHLWNYFDGINVLFSIVDMVSTLLDLQVSGALSVLRLARLARILRILRLSGKLPLVRNLTVMLHSVTVSFGSIVPALMLFAMTVYIFGVGIMQGAIQYIRLEEDGDESVKMDKELLALYFGSIESVFWTLIACVSGGHDWANVAEPIVHIGVGYAFLFLIYIMFTIFALLNILTGVFVNAASQTSTLTREIATDSAIAEMMMYEVHLMSLFKSADMEADGLLSQEEFALLMGDERNRAFLNALHLDFNCIERVFEVMDQDGSGQLDLAEFVETCVSLRGEATALHVRFLADDMAKLDKKIENILEVLGDR